MAAVSCRDPYVTVSLKRKTVVCVPKNGTGTMHSPEALVATVVPSPLVPYWIVLHFVMHLYSATVLVLPYTYWIVLPFVLVRAPSWYE